MLPSSFSARNSSQRVELNTQGDAVGYRIKQFQELHFSVFESCIWHVVHERDADAIGSCGRSVHRFRPVPVHSLGPTGRNPAALDDQWHDIPPELTGGTVSFNFMLWPCLAPGPDRPEY